MPVIRAVCGPRSVDRRLIGQLVGVIENQPAFNRDVLEGSERHCEPNFIVEPEGFERGPIGNALFDVVERPVDFLAVGRSQPRQRSAGGGRDRRPVRVSRLHEQPRFGKSAVVRMRQTEHQVVNVSHYPPAAFERATRLAMLSIVSNSMSSWRPGSTVIRNVSSRKAMSSRTPKESMMPLENRGAD